MLRGEGSVISLHYNLEFQPRVLHHSLLRGLWFGPLSSSRVSRGVALLALARLDRLVSFFSEFLFLSDQCDRVGLELAAVLPQSTRVGAHSARGLAASSAWFRRASLEEVSAAVGWASPLTFARFYCLNLTSSVAVGPP